MSERMFPVQASGRNVKPHPTRIPWSIADKAYSRYSARHGRQQSLERLAERGGFHPDEMDEYYPPWREETDEITALRAQLAAVERDRDERLAQVLYTRDERDTNARLHAAAEQRVAALTEALREQPGQSVLLCTV